MNLYCYCGNDPINFVDPSGHDSLLVALLIGLGVGVAAGLGVAVYSDYQDNYDVDGSIGLDYLWWSIISGATGAMIGFGIGYFLPMIIASAGTGAVALTSYGAGKALALVGGGSKSIAGAGILEAMLAAGALILFASNNKPGNNQVQNKHIKNAIRKAGCNPNDNRIKDEINKMEKYIRRNHEDFGWKELLEFVKEWLG